MKRSTFEVLIDHTDGLSSMEPLFEHTLAHSTDGIYRVECKAVSTEELSIPAKIDQIRISDIDGKHYICLGIDDHWVWTKISKERGEYPNYKILRKDEFETWEIVSS
jgi:hypothetical protein